jgi:quercetin dioxygenase-like cupin family protein
MEPERSEMVGAEMVVGADELEATMAFFAELGFELAMIMPADEPSMAVLEGHGLRLRLDPEHPGGPGALRIPWDDTNGGIALPDGVDGLPARLAAPNGTFVDLVVADPPLDLGPLVPSFVLTPGAEGSDDGPPVVAWHPGRAGMLYRDLIPDRQGGRFIASHISIPRGGPVPDYVHHHHIRFQLIYCRRGWAELVYEDQGPPFRFEAGDCVLQPPHIRHQVLATSDRFEAVEVGCPAIHETLRDREVELPTTTLHPERRYGGQRFVHHQAARASWVPWRFDGFRCRRFGFGEATGGIGGARVVRPAQDAGEPVVPRHRHDADLVFWFVLEGRATLARGGDLHVLDPGASAVLPRGELHGLHDCSPDLQWLEVTLPAWPRDMRRN